MTDDFALRIHFTNVKGLGAIQLLKSLLPSIDSLLGLTRAEFHLPDSGPLSFFVSCNPLSTCTIYRRFLPNAISRILECTILSYKFDGSAPLLVLGDLPLRVKGPQTVFVQTPNLISEGYSKWRMVELKYLVSRLLFRHNAKYADAFIVQTEVMKYGLEKTFPAVLGKVHVISQPVPSWLFPARAGRKSRVDSERPGLTLIYPAAHYPHKNHKLLSNIVQGDDWPVEELWLTLNEWDRASDDLTWLRYVGFLSPKDMIDAYLKVDGVLFLSKRESYGFPLVEAMFVGLPIVCPDLPYAHTLCGDQAIYFDPDSSRSLREAIIELRDKLDGGWWPCWASQLKLIPSDWDSVAIKMVAIALDKNAGS